MAGFTMQRSITPSNQTSFVPMGDNADLNAAWFRNAGAVGKTNSGGASGVAPRVQSNSYLDAYQEAYKAAQARELAREADITQGYQDRYSRGMSLLKGLGGQSKKDINQLYGEQGKQAQAQVQQMGLGNTTVGQQIQRGVDREHSNALIRANEGIRQQQLGVESGLSGDLLAFKERPSTAYPDLNLMAQLASQGGGNNMNQAYGGYSSGGGAVGMVPAFMGTLGMPAQYGSYGGGYGGSQQQSSAPQPQQQPAAVQQDSGSLANPNMGSNQQAAAAAPGSLGRINGNNIYQASNGKYYATDGKTKSAVYKNPRTGQWQYYA